MTCIGMQKEDVWTDMPKHIGSAMRKVHGLAHPATIRNITDIQLQLGNDYYKIDAITKPMKQQQKTFVEEANLPNAMEDLSIVDVEDEWSMVDASRETHLSRHQKWLDSLHGPKDDSLALRVTLQTVPIEGNVPKWDRLRKEAKVIHKVGGDTTPVDTLRIKSQDFGCYTHLSFCVENLDITSVHRKDFDAVFALIHPTSFPLKSIKTGCLFNPEKFNSGGNEGLEHKIFKMCKELHLLADPTNFLDLAHKRVVFPIVCRDLKSSVMDLYQEWKIHGRDVGTSWSFRPSDPEHMDNLWQSLIEIPESRVFDIKNEILVPLTENTEMKFYWKCCPGKEEWFELKVQWKE